MSLFTLTVNPRVKGMSTCILSQPLLPVTTDIDDCSTDRWNKQCLQENQEKCLMEAWEAVDKG